MSANEKVRGHALTSATPRAVHAPGVRRDMRSIQVEWGELNEKPVERGSGHPLIRKCAGNLCDHYFAHDQAAPIHAFAQRLGRSAPEFRIRAEDVEQHVGVDSSDHSTSALPRSASINPSVPRDSFRIP